MHNEDRELQIKLAELQADIQINISICIGIFAILVAIMIGLEQIYFTLPEQSIERIYIFIPELGLAIFSFVAVVPFARRAENARKKMAELRKQYVW